MFPEPAAAVLGRSRAYGHWLSTEAAAPPAAVDVDVERANELIASAVGEGPAGSIRNATAQLLRAYGVRVPATLRARPPKPRPPLPRSASRWPSRRASAASDDPSARVSRSTCRNAADVRARRSR